MSGLIRWILAIMAIGGAVALTPADGLTEGIEDGFLTTVVQVYDCPFEGADVVQDCRTVYGVVIDVLVDGVAIEGSGAVSAPGTTGFGGVIVEVPVDGGTITASAPGVSLTVAVADIDVRCDPADPCGFIELVRVVDLPEDPAYVGVIVANCPYAEADISDECITIEGSVVHVAVDGVELPGSPSITTLNPVFQRTANFVVPLGSTLTVWAEPNGDGYGPAAGYDPLTIGPESFYLGGCGGESRCSYVFLVEVPVVAEEPGDEPAETPVVEEPTPDVDDAPTDLNVPTGDTPGDRTGLVGGEVVTRLPSTGIGPALGDGGLDRTSLALMLTWPLVAGLAAGSALRRGHAPR